MYEYCDERGIPYQRCGKLIVAKDASEVPALDELERRATTNGVPGLRRLAGDEIADVEPHCVGEAALHSPNTGIVDFAAVAARWPPSCDEAGASVVTGAGVESVWTTAGGITARHGQGPDPRPLPGLLRGAVVGPDGRAGRRRPRPAHRALPRGLPAPEARRSATWSRA